MRVSLANFYVIPAQIFRDGNGRLKPEYDNIGREYQCGNGSSLDRMGSYFAHRVIGAGNWWQFTMKIQPYQAFQLSSSLGVSFLNPA